MQMENPQRRPNVQAEPIGDGMGIFDPQQGQSYVLNTTTALVWQHCDGQTTTQQLAEFIKQKFNLTSEQADQLMQMALDELEEANLLEKNASQQPTYSRRQLITTFMAAGLSLALIPIVSRSQAMAQETTSTPEMTFEFDGFYPPVENPPTVNEVRAGRAIPIKFSLNGDQGLDIFLDGFPASQQVDCQSSDLVIPIQETVTAGQSTLSYDADADQYIYVWKTDRDWAGTCREFRIKLTDGQMYTALFSFT
jgi:hypothetical protein